MKKLFIFLFIIILQVSAQISFSGYVFDSVTKQPLENSNLVIKEFNSGTTTNPAGYFKLSNLPDRTFTLIVSYIGYETKEVKIDLAEQTEYNIYLSPAEIMYGETIVEASRAKQRETPLAFSEIDKKEIDLKLGSRDVIHILQTSPSIYISPEGGGTGDLRLNIRGFDQTNIGVMLNGVPVNNPENGEVYWSNWAGIADVVDYIQVQRGLGSSPYSVPAVGGLLNIVTTGFNTQKNYTKVNTEIGSDNFRKYTAAVSSNLGSQDLHFTALLSRKLWDGYADRTSLEELTYYFSLGTVFGNQSVLLQVIGSPQEHGQRITPQTIDTWDKYGLRYNADWGYLNGKPLNIRDNNFHKPSFNLIHNAVLSKKLTLSNVLYYTYGTGGGTVPPYASFDRTENGLINFDKEWKINSSNIDSTYSAAQSRSLKALRKVYHKHHWFGFVSSLKEKVKNLNFSGGIDAKYYYAQNYATLGNLLGGDYYIGYADINRAPGTLLHEGDKVDYDADSYAIQYGGFIQSEYNNNIITTYLNLSVSNTSYNRIDFFNYTPDSPKRETGWENFIGFTVKGGINYNLNSQNNIYLNTGYLSKAPLSFNVFDYSNNRYRNVKNEKIFSLEAGYGFKDDKLVIDINTFLTQWKDKAISRTIQDETSGQYFFYNISGADAMHIGIETELTYRLTNNLLIRSMFSNSINKWTSNVNTTLAPESNPTQRTDIESFVDGLYVGNFPMTTASLELNYRRNLFNSAVLTINPVYKFIGRFYADYDPDNRSSKDNSNQNSWQLPDFYLIDLHGAVDFSTDNFLLKKISIGFHIFNILNKKHIVYGLDGISHTSSTAQVFYGRERYWQLSFALNF